MVINLQKLGQAIPEFGAGIMVDLVELLLIPQLWASSGTDGKIAALTTLRIIERIGGDHVIGHHFDILELFIKDGPQRHFLDADIMPAFVNLTTGANDIEILHVCRTWPLFRYGEKNNELPA